MNVIYRIARTEFKILFYTPIAWMVLVLFVILFAMGFENQLEKLLMLQLRGNVLKTVTYNLLALQEKGVFSLMQEYLYMYIPFLTMGIMSRELADDSIKLLYSSPLSSVQIILGKYFSLITFGLFLMVVPLIFVLLGACWVKDFNMSLALSGLLGLYLLMCAYAAVGLFMSSLTSHQVVAAISTLTTLALLNYIKYWGQDIEFIRDIVYWISFSAHSDNLVNGMICCEDILYFFVISALFLALAIVRLRAILLQESRKRTLVKCGILVVSVCVLVCLLVILRLFMPCYDTMEISSNQLDTAILVGLPDVDMWMQILTWALPIVLIIIPASILYYRNRR